MEQLVGQAIAPLQFTVDGFQTIFGVPRQRMANAGQMGADLMAFPGYQLYFQQSKILRDGNRGIGCMDMGLFSALLRRWSDNISARCAP